MSERTKSPKTKTKVLPEGNGEPLLLPALAERYLKHLEQLGKTRGTVFSYEIDLGLAITHFGKDTNVRTLTEKEVAKFFNSDAVTKKRSGKPKAEPTILKTRRVLRLALAWAVEAGLLNEAPLPTPAKRAPAAPTSPTPTSTAIAASAS